MAHLRMCCGKLGHHGLATLKVYSGNIVSPMLQSRRMAGSRNRFWELNKKGGYKNKVKLTSSKTKMIKDGLSMMGTEMGKFTEEVKDKLKADPILGTDAGDYEVLWKFDNQDTIDKWILTTDRDHQEGGSKSELILGRNKMAKFQGVINTQVPKDGVTKRAGYVNIRSPKNMKSFQREHPYDWSMFTHLVMRVRGDGRPYQLLMHMDRYFDIGWNDQYHYTLFTRGGPYWQTSKIPFSKFYLTGKGRIQDKQESIVNQLWQVSYMGITLADNSPGPFGLEIDYIGVMFDATHREQFAYEMYETTPAAMG